MPPAASDKKVLRLNTHFPLDGFIIDSKAARYPVVPTAAAILLAARLFCQAAKISSCRRSGLPRR
jgi:hypothetical protein